MRYLSTERPVFVFPLPYTVAIDVVTGVATPTMVADPGEIFVSGQMWSDAGGFAAILAVHVDSLPGNWDSLIWNYQVFLVPPLSLFAELGAGTYALTITGPAGPGGTFQPPTVAIQWGGAFETLCAAVGAKAHNRTIAESADAAGGMASSGRYFEQSTGKLWVRTPDDDAWLGYLPLIDNSALDAWPPSVPHAADAFAKQTGNLSFVVDSTGPVIS